MQEQLSHACSDCICLNGANGCELYGSFACICSGRVFTLVQTQLDMFLDALSELLIGYRL